MFDLGRQFPALGDAYYFLSPAAGGYVPWGKLCLTCRCGGIREVLIRADVDSDILQSRLHIRHS